MLSVSGPIRAAAGASALLFILFCAPASAADDAQALLAKHKAFVGWQFGDGTFASLAVDAEKANVSTGKVVEHTHSLNRGVLYRTTTTTSEGASNDGFTGNIFWASDMNGFPRPVRGDVVKYTVSEQMLFNEATPLLPGESRGSTTVNGTPVSIVRVKPEQGDAIDLYVDPATGAYKRAVIDPDGVYQNAFDITEYTDVSPGKKIVGKWKYDGSSYEHRVTKAVANPTVSNDDLHPPAQTATWDFKNDRPFKIRFLDRDGGPRIIVEAKVNGVPGRFILDTGASTIALSRHFADRAGVKRQYATVFGGIAGTLKGEIAKADTVEVGGNVLHNVLLGAGGDEMDSEAPDGLLGFDLLAGAIVNVSLDDQTMTILDPKTHQVDHNQGILVAADLSNGTPYIPMKVNGSVDVNALLDSGAGTYVLYSSKLLNHGVRMMVDNSNLASHLAISGVSGGYEVGDCGNLDAISVGPVVYDHAPACQVRSSVGEREIIVGLDFLKGFNLVFDYPDSYMVFTPRKQ